MLGVEGAEHQLRLLPLLPLLLLEQRLLTLRVWLRVRLGVRLRPLGKPGR
jgi:hypothetical protein